MGSSRAADRTILWLFNTCLFSNYFLSILSPILIRLPHARMAVARIHFSPFGIGPVRGQWVMGWKSANPSYHCSVIWYLPMSCPIRSAIFSSPFIDLTAIPSHHQTQLSFPALFQNRSVQNLHESHYQLYIFQVDHLHIF